ncbi:SctK family type III secretion system sorting platform protein [Cognatiyoonia sp. IB215182]|uniref:SctK family type III secretion system sorting platform protein n=1 Tax=Cognatiyoonia sp. IB215182 TaxID=3097353 RepID=UPI002A17AF3E|nr:SctK family type III secretion system sorting platform protein [Cognatiyoonia sp. IB215182]MDX8355133.1 SctK family type III secretion system sorting platform protein [Cognatiyoonia sp. IB215182]
MRAANDTLSPTVALAAVLATPVRFFHPDHLAPVTRGLPQAQLAQFCQVPEFAARLNATIAQSIGTAGLQLQENTIKRMSRDEMMRPALRLLTAPYNVIEALLRQFTAVRLQLAIRNCVLKADRQRVRSVLGDAACNTALREAPFFYANIADNAARLPVADDAEMPAVLEAGAAMMHSYIASIDAGLAQVFAWRLPKAYLAEPIALEPAQLKTCARLLASKGSDGVGA